MEYHLLARNGIAGNNADVPQLFARAARKIAPSTWNLIALSGGAMIAFCVVLAGCSAPAKDFVDKVTVQADGQCRQGNQAACHTIVQQLTETKVGIESTGTLDITTAACNSGNLDACEQAAVLHVELSGWCSAGNAKACAAVSAGPWPKKMDEPALIDAAKLNCLSGHFKESSNTCQALTYF
jgi:hypothetical protein